MSSKWGARLRRHYQDLATGIQVAPVVPPKAFPIKYKSFRLGLMLADRAADVPEGYFSYGVDVEVSRRDGIIRAPGVTLVEDTLVDLEWMAVQTGLDFQSVLVAFSPPYIGVKESGNFVWTNIGLEVAGGWVTSRYGDVLLFSNGSTSYARDLASGVVTVVPSMPGAATLFTAFGRVFAGGVVTDGEFNVLGLQWSGLEGDYTDWVGAGSGAELLIADVEQTDKIVAGRVISYDLVAILCRRSLWVGARTGDVARPADLQFRLLGVGCVSEPTAKTTEAGVTFLSDEGVRHFDGTNAPIISGAINSELLPIDFTQIKKYKSAWDASRRRYILGTPRGTYVYQFKTAEYPNGAWFFRSIIPTSLVVFGKQTADPTWNDFGEQTWDDLGALTWFQLGTPEDSTAPDVIFSVGTRYGIQDYAAITNLGTVMIPVIQPRPDQPEIADLADRVFSTQSFLIEYYGSGTIDILAENEQGVVVLVGTKVLPATLKARSIRADILGSSRATGIFVKITAGFPEIVSIKQILQDNGPVISDGVSEVFTEDADTDILTESEDGIILWL